MANPRKFSEKIALHNQKQAEETAEFEKIMREVSDATNKGSRCKRQQLHISNQSLGTFRAGSLPNVNKIMMSAQLELKSALSCMDELKTTQAKNHTYRERPRSAVGPMRSRPAEKRIDTSPYSGPYLSPPPDTPWRRTHSDSSLHTSSHDSNSYRKGALDCHSQLLDDYDTSRRLCSASPEARPRSATDMSRVPGISIYPSTQEPGTIQIPIGNNTGSLPDLTSFHFPSPLNTPLDHEDHNSQFAHTYHYGSPRSLSPQPLSRPMRFNYISTPPHEAPGPPMSMNHANHSNRLSVPSDDGFKYLHQYKGRAHESYDRHLSYLPPISSIQQSYCNQGAPTIQTEANSHQSALTRSSPQHMPQSLTVYKLGSPSPCSSSPQSPPSPTNAQCSINSNDHNSYFIGQANALQHHFEQFSMIDSPSGINLDYIGSNSPLQADDAKGRNHELTPDPGYFSTSPSQHNAYVHGAHESTAPNTPSSIPNIILTDFSNSEDLAKDFEVAMADTFEQDLFPTDECLREGLDPIDLDGLQMLTDPELIADPATEHHLRLDRL